MISFENDYAQGCHPQILEALVRSNETPAPGYGKDPWTQEAHQIIGQRVGRPDARVFLMPGGTITNLVAIHATLGPHQAVLAPHSGHIVRHEAGAIEATGHRVILVPSADGRVTPESVQAVLEENLMAPHMAQPRMLYISQATELGTVYSKAQLEALAQFCRTHGLLFFVDGARLGNAVQASDMSLEDLGQLVDMFWIGGTKNGALMGEALVVTDPKLAPGMAYVQKQRGALLSKGRLAGLSFIELLREDLYFELAQHANDMAARLTKGLSEVGFTFEVPTQTNQVFVRIPNAELERLETQFAFHRWCDAPDEHTTIRLVTSWMSREQEVDAFLAAATPS